MAELILYQTECHWQLWFKSPDPNSRKRTCVCCYRMNHVLNTKNVSFFIQKHSVAKLLPTRQLTNVLPRLKLLNAITAFTPLMVFLFIIYNQQIYLYRVSQEECEILREGVPYVKVYRYNPKHIYPKLNGYGDNGQRKVWTSCISAYCTSTAVGH